ncbi:MAG TPA: DUF4124 domain-containing protein [Gammaproteobacteria bacterium]|nr:DUF4124 domain-containing protein [Gammaproteobacteria bacterium]
MVTSPVFLWFILVFYFFSGQSCIAEVYRWTNDKGEIVFGDRPPKGVDVDIIPLKKAVGSGMEFATPEQIKKLHTDVQVKKKTKPRAGGTRLSKSYCQRYRSNLNKVEIYLQHTYNVQDAQKAQDLRKLIKRECNGITLSVEDNRSRCKSYRQELVRTEIYLEHTSTPRDRQKVNDLRKQIRRECQ